MGDLGLSDAIQRADEFLVSTDSTSRHEIENQRDGWQDGRPQGTEIHCSPRLVANSLTHNEEAHVPSNDQQGIEGTEERLHLAVVVDEDGVRPKGGRGQKDGHQGPRVEMTMPQRVGVPEVVHLSYRQPCCLEGADLHGKTHNGQNDCRCEEYGLFTLPHC